MENGGVRQVNKVLEIWRSKGVRTNKNYRGATKRWHRGELRNNVKQQKKGIAVDSKIL